MLVLLMGEINDYVVEIATGNKIKLPSFMTIGSSIHVILRLLW
jgi:hypothetical protein